MQEFDIERGFITRLLVEQDIEVVRENKITEKFFTGDSRNAFKYILEITSKTGELPTVRAFQRALPRYKLEKDSAGEVGTDENLLYWINELRRKVKHNTLADGVEEAAKLLNEGLEDEAEAFLRKKFYFVDLEVNNTGGVNLKDDIDARKQEYERRVLNKGVTGIPTGIPFLDFMFKGLSEDTLTTMIASTGVGKTFMQVLIGSYAILNDYKVLQCVTEMSSRQMRDRYEAVLYGMTVGAFNMNEFKSGSFSPEMKRSYFNFLDEVMSGIDLPIETAESPLQVEALVQKHKADLLLIDGVYLMNDDKGAESDWLRIANITRSLKQMIKRLHIAGFINTQADGKTSRKTGPELGDIMYSQSIGQDSDNVFTAYRTPLMYEDREICLKILKGREGGTGKCMLSWDFTNMQFKEIYSEKAKGDFEAPPQEGDSNDGMFIEVPKGEK